MGDIDWRAFGWGREPDHPTKTCGPWGGSEPFIPQRYEQTRRGPRGAIMRCDIVQQVSTYYGPDVHVIDSAGRSRGWLPWGRWLQYGEVIDG